MSKGKPRGKRRFVNEYDPDTSIFEHNEWVAHGADGEVERLSNLRKTQFNIKISPTTRELVKFLGFTKELQLPACILIENLLASLHRSSKLIYSRNKNKDGYRTRNKRKIKIPTRHIIKVVNHLVNCDFVVNNVGISSQSVAKRTISYLTPTESFVKMLGIRYKNLKERLESSYRAYTDIQPVIILRDENKEERTLENLNQKVLEALKTTKDEFCDMTETVTALNKMNSEHIIVDQYAKLMNNEYCRIFNRDFLHGGRFYRAEILKTGSGEDYNRLAIRIDGEPVVEVDFSTLHFRIALQLLNKELPDNKKDDRPLPFDIYEHILGNYIDIYPNSTREVHTDINRRMIKKSINIMFNCDTRYQALLAIQKQIDNIPESDLPKYTLDDAETIITVIMFTWDGYQDLFFRKNHFGLRLQNEDSHIASEVLKVFIALDKPILPIHDSFVTAISNLDLLTKTMADCFRARYNLPPSHKVPLSVSFKDYSNGAGGYYSRMGGMY